MSDRVAVGEYAAVIAEHLGVVRQLYNDPGIAFTQSVLETEYTDYDRRFAVNLRRVIHSTKARLPRRVASGDGHLINAR
ncbi:MAG: hypothetical protein ACRDPA_29670 [Solirubrobacteraceae bacterium]